MASVVKAGKSLNGYASLLDRPFKANDTNDLLVSMLGRPDGPKALTQDALSSNLVLDDIFAQWMDRPLVYVSQAITAAIANDRASIVLTAIAPIVETPKTTFEIQHEEWNMVPFTRVTDYGIPRQITRNTRESAYTVQRKKQMIVIEKNFLLDPVFGPKYWEQQLVTLGKNAQLTLVIDVYHMLTEVPFRQMMTESVNGGPFDHNRYFNYETRDFGAASVSNPNRFLNSLLKARPNRMAIPFDTILAPEGTFQQLRDVAAEGKPVMCARTEYSPQTKQLQSVMYKGPRANKTLTVADRTVSLIELPSLYCNMRDQTEKVFHPLQSAITVATVIPFALGPASQRFRRPVGERFDVYAYVMTPTEGHQHRFEFAKALDNCFLYNKVTGLPSAGYTGFLSHLNDKLGDGTRQFPSEWSDVTDVNDETASGVDGYTPDMVKGKRNLTDMKGFRDEFPFFTYDPVDHVYRLPRHMGDMHQKQLTNERILQAASLVMMAATADSNPESVNVNAFNEIVDLVMAIRRQSWEPAYVQGLIQENAPFLHNGAGVVLPDVYGRHTNDRTPQWMPNEFGALRLPQNMGPSSDNITYPAGFGSYAGLKTLEQEVNRGHGPWHQIGIKARAALRNFEVIYQAIAQFVPESELVDERNTAPWFHVNDGGRSLVLDTIVQLKTGNARPGPVFLGNMKSGADGIFVGEMFGNGEGTFDAGSDNPKFFGGDFKDAKDFKKKAESGSDLSRVMLLGAFIGESAFQSLSVVGVILDAIFKTKNFEVAEEGKEVKNATGASIAENLLDRVRIVLERNMPNIDANNTIMGELAQKLKGLNGNGVSGDGENIVVTFDAVSKIAGFIASIKQNPVVSGKPAQKSLPAFDVAIRNNAITDNRNAALNKPPKTSANNRAIKWIRAPLEATGDMSRAQNTVVAASKSTNYTEYVSPKTETNIDDNGEDQDDGGRVKTAPNIAATGSSRTLRSATTKSQFDVFAYPVAANVFGLGSTFAAASASSARGSSRAPQTAPVQTVSSLLNTVGMNYGGYSAASGAATWSDPFAADLSSVSFDPPSTTSAQQGRKFAPKSFDSVPSRDAFFGPWRARLEWLANNVTNGFERLVCLAIMMARNRLQTHKALLRVGAALMGFDGCRMGITVNTAAIVRMVRGHRTMFTALSRVTALPGLESVTGEYMVTAEMFNGVVSTEPSNIELLPHAIIRDYVGGKGERPIEHMSELAMPVTASGDMLYMPLSENADTRSYPQNALNANSYYNDSTTMPSPFRKVQWAEFFEFLAGPAITEQMRDTVENGRVSFYASESRSIVLHREATYHYNEYRGDFSTRVPGTGTIGSVEFNMAESWRGFNGGAFPDSAGDKPTPF